ncbi:MAG: hypothetical protein NXI31_07625 [bacterium]|nr:hypothetical protein [bacterium]
MHTALTLTARSISALALSVLATTVAAQAVHIVGPSTSFPQIRDAVAVANRNDVLLVLPGTYAQFELTVGLSIRAATAGTVRIEFDPAYVDPACAQSIFCAMTQGSTELAVPATDRVQLVGLEFVDNVALVGAFQVPHRVVLRSGRFVLDECVIRSRGDTALTAYDCLVNLQDTTVANTGGGLTGDAANFLRSTVLASSCSFTGGQGALPGAARAITISDSTLNGSFMTLTAGTDSSALYTDTNAEVWLSDSTLTATNNRCAMEFNGSVGHYDRCTLSTATGPCYMLPPGDLLGAERFNGLFRGGVSTSFFQTDPSALVGIVASFELTPSPLPFIEQPWLASPTTSPAIGIVVADASGLASWSWTVPASAPTGMAVWLHGVSGTTFPLQAAPPVGGPIR